MSQNIPIPRNTVLAVAALGLLGWSVAQSQESTDSTTLSEHPEAMGGATMRSPRAGARGGLPMMGPGGAMGAGMVSGSGPAGFPTPDFAVQQQMELKQLLDRYSELDDAAEQEKVKESINTLLTQMFEERQERRAAEIADVEQRLTRLKVLHKKREELKKTIIANRLQQLLEDSEGLGWGDETPMPSAGLIGNFFGGPTSGGWGSLLGGNSGFKQPDPAGSRKP